MKITWHLIKNAKLRPVESDTLEVVSSRLGFTSCQVILMHAKCWRPLFPGECSEERLCYLSLGCRHWALRFLHEIDQWALQHMSEVFAGKLTKSRVAQFCDVCYDNRACIKLFKMPFLIYKNKFCMSDKAELMWAMLDLEQKGNACPFSYFFKRYFVVNPF